MPVPIRLGACPAIAGAAVLMAATMLHRHQRLIRKDGLVGIKSRHSTENEAKYGFLTAPNLLRISVDLFDIGA